jgi:hypothetical protein
VEEDLMVEIDGIRYHNLSSAAVYLNISRFMFYTNVKPYVTAYQGAARGRLLYKEADLAPFRRVEAVVHIA